MRLLIVRLSAMGDIVHALPLAENARAAGATVGWTVEEAFAGLLEGNPNCARLFTAATRRWRRRPLSSSTWRDMGRLREALREFAPDRTIDAQGLWKSALVARAAGAPVVGLTARARREPGSALLCGIRVPPGAPSSHAVDRNLALLSAIGLPARRAAPDASYLLSRPAGGAEEFLSSLPRPFAVYHPGA